MSERKGGGKDQKREGVLSEWGTEGESGDCAWEVEVMEARWWEIDRRSQEVARGRKRSMVGREGACNQ